MLSLPLPSQSLSSRTQKPSIDSRSFDLLLSHSSVSLFLVLSLILAILAILAVMLSLSLPSQSLSSGTQKPSIDSRSFDLLLSHTDISLLLVLSLILAVMLSLSLPSQSLSSGSQTALNAPPTTVTIEPFPQLHFTLYRLLSSPSSPLSTFTVRTPPFSLTSNIPQGSRMPTPESDYSPTPTLNVSLAVTDASSDSLGEERTVQMTFVDHVSDPDSLKTGTPAIMLAVVYAYGRGRDYAGVERICLEWRAIPHFFPMPLSCLRPQLLLPGLDCA